MTDIVMSTQNLAKRFGGIVASDGVSFELREGEIHGLIGPNGAGKTTFIAQLAGLLRPDSGVIRLRGRDITRAGTVQRARDGLSRTFQITSIFPDFTVFENVLLAKLAHVGHCFRFWSPVRADLGLAEQVLETLGQLSLQHCRDVKAAALSHGERRLLEIAIAIAGAPSVLLLDEPTSGLGSRESEEVKRLLHAWRGRYSILLVEHDMDAVFRLCDRVSVMASGRLIASGTPAEIKSSEEVQRAYLGDQDDV